MNTNDRKTKTDIKLTLIFVPPFSHIHLTTYSNTCHFMSVLNLLKLSVVIWSSYLVYHSRFISPTNLPWPKARRKQQKSIPYNQQLLHCFLASWGYPYHFIFSVWKYFLTALFFKKYLPKKKTNYNNKIDGNLNSTKKLQNVPKVLKHWI